MDELAIVSNRLLAGLTWVQQVAEGGGSKGEAKALVREARQLHHVLMNAMAESPRLVNDDLRAFAAFVDGMLASIESALARADRQIH